MTWWAQDVRRTAGMAGEANQYNYQPYSGGVLAIDPDGEEVKVDMGVSGIGKLSFPHPFLSGGAWHRAIPMGFGQVLLQKSADKGEPQIVRFVADKTINTVREFSALLRELKKDPTSKDVASKVTVPMRPLRPGEQEMMSSGLASVYLSDMGTLELRGAGVTRLLLGRDGEVVDRAPLHVRTGLLYSHGSNITDTERFGIVKRPDPDKPSFREKPILIDNPVGFTPPPSGGLLGAATAALGALTPKSAAKEWFVDLGYDGLPDRLYRHRIGHVFDDDAEGAGDQVKSDETGKKLRARYQWFVDKTGSELVADVDELGNVIITFPVEALTGLKVALTAGSIDLGMLDLIVTALRNITMTSTGKTSISGTAGVEVTSNALVAIKGLLTMLGETSGLTPVVNGVLTGETLDPLTGLPFSTFAQGSSVVLAKK